MSLFDEFYTIRLLKNIKKHPVPWSIGGGAAALGVGGHSLYNFLKGVKEKGFVSSEEPAILNPMSYLVGSVMKPAIKQFPKRVQPLIKYLNEQKQLELLEKLKEKYADKDIAVHVGGRPAFRSIGRAWGNPNISIPGKLAYTGLYPFISLSSAVGGPHYDPMSKSIVLSKGLEAPGILAHEFGHFLGIKNKPKGFIKPKSTFAEEVRASRQGLDILREHGMYTTAEKERLKAALRTYLIGISQSPDRESMDFLLDAAAGGKMDPDKLLK